MPQEPEPLEMVKSVIEAAEERGARLRLIGGLAIALQCPSARHRNLARSYGDFDFIGYRRQRSELIRILTDQGLEPHQRFNAQHGHRRLLFWNPHLDQGVDVFLDLFPMCHTLDFSGRLHEERYTVPLTELLLSKLQIVELNEKDVRDSFALLLDHPVRERPEPGSIGLQRVNEVTSRDWGWYKTVSLNLSRLTELVEEFLEGNELETVRERLTRIDTGVQDSPKSLTWKLRSLVGERLRWYELPEEVNY